MFLEGLLFTFNSVEKYICQIECCDSVGLFVVFQN